MRILEILFPVFSLILVGYAYGKLFKPDMKSVNTMVLYVFLPALVFDVMSSGDFALLTYRWLMLASLLVVLGSGLIAWFAGWLLKLPLRAFVPTMMFNNCGNLGLPLAVLAYGDSALAAAMVLFLVSNLIHFTLGIVLFGGALTLTTVIFNPVNIATFAGLAFNFLDIQLWQTLATPISMLGDIVIPIMLVSLGVRMTSVDLSNWSIGIIAAVVCPLSGLIVALLIAPWIPLDNFQYGLLILFAALPPAVLNFLFSEQFDQRPDQVASMVLIGNAGSVIVLSIVLALIV